MSNYGVIARGTISARSAIFGLVFMEIVRLPSKHRPTTSRTRATTPAVPTWRTPSSRFSSSSTPPPLFPAPLSASLSSKRLATLLAPAGVKERGEGPREAAEDPTAEQVPVEPSPSPSPTPNPNPNPALGPLVPQPPPPPPPPDDDDGPISLLPSTPVAVTAAAAAAAAEEEEEEEEERSRWATDRTATALMSLRSRPRSAVRAEPMAFRSAQRDPVGIETCGNFRRVRFSFGGGAGSGERSASRVQTCVSGM